jgi:hypothetical protein
MAHVGADRQTSALPSHKSWFFAAKDSQDNAINYVSAVRIEKRANAISK